MAASVVVTLLLVGVLWLVHVGFWAHLHEPVKFSSSSLPLLLADHCICVFFYRLLGFHGIVSLKVHLGFVIFFFGFFCLLFILVIHCQIAPLFFSLRWISCMSAFKVSSSLKSSIRKVICFISESISLHALPIAFLRKFHILNMIW